MDFHILASLDQWLLVVAMLDFILSWPNHILNLAKQDTGDSGMYTITVAGKNQIKVIWQMFVEESEQVIVV